MSKSLLFNFHERIREGVAFVNGNVRTAIGAATPGLPTVSAVAKSCGNHL
jgi:hypothetical protein